MWVHEREESKMTLRVVGLTAVGQAKAGARLSISLVLAYRCPLDI